MLPSALRRLACVCRCVDSRKFNAAPVERQPRRVVAKTVALSIVLPSSESAYTPSSSVQQSALEETALAGGRATLPISRKKMPVCLLDFLQSFDAATFGDGLTALLHAVNSGALPTRRLQAAERQSLRQCCEEWTGERWRGSRTAAHLHSVLHLHRLLQLSPSPGLRANTRLWLSANCLNLQPAQLFPFFRSLASIFIDDNRQTEGDRIYAKSRRPPTAASDLDMDLLQRLALKARRCLAEASPADLAYFLREFGRLGVNPSQFEPEILGDLLSRLTENFERLTLDECCAVVTAIHRLSLKPDRAFWLAVKKRFAEANAVVAARCLDTFGRLLVKRECISQEMFLAIADVLSARMLTGLGKIALRPLLRNSWAVTVHPELGVKHLTQNTAIWPVLLRRAQNVAQFTGDAKGLQMLCRVLAWAPSGLRAEVEALVEAISNVLKDEVSAILQNGTVARPITEDHFDIYGMMRKRLKLVQQPRPSTDSVQEYFTHERQLWHPHSASAHPLKDVFHHLSYLPPMLQRRLIAPPTAQWWLALRQRSADDPFQLSSENWACIVRTVRELLCRPHEGHSYLLPPSWYTTLLALAAQPQPMESQRARVEATGNLFWLLCRQRIQLDAWRQVELKAVFDQCLAAAVPTERLTLLNYAVDLELPISEESWGRVCWAKLLCRKPKVFIERLLISAASYWALALPGAPPAHVLQRLVQAAQFDKACARVPCLWQKVHLLLGGEFMPREFLERLNSPSPELSVLKRDELAGNGKLQARLKLEYGPESVQVNAVLPGVAGSRADYLVTQADGSQKVFVCDSPRLHYWQMPDDQQGAFTLSMRVFIHLLEKAGYSFEVVNSDS